MRTIAVNGRWPVLLPDHRADRPGWDQHEAARFESMTALEPGKVLWDVGAELGDHAAVYASWGLVLVLIEPNPRAWPCIAATIDANDRRYNLAGWVWSFVGDQDDGIDPGRMYDGYGGFRWPAASVGPCDGRAGMAHLSGRPDPDPYPVQPMTTIDALAATRLARPDALTIDVEGTELRVIRGAVATLEEHRPRIWLSLHRELMAGYGDDPDDLFALLLDLGYRGELLAVDHEEHWKWTP